MSIPLPPSAKSPSETLDPVELAREHTLTAVYALAQVAQFSKSDAARVAASNSLLDRGYGKPDPSAEPSRVEVTVNMSPTEAYKTLVDA